MPNIFTFRVLLDAKEDVFRDIQIRSNDLYFNLHTAILKAFEFDTSQMASFYMSDEDWNKGQEVTLMKMDFDDGSSTLEMDVTPIDQFTSEVGDKMVYVYDFMLMWCFYVDLIKVEADTPSLKLPECVHYYGSAPYQYGKKLSPKPGDDKHLLSNKKQVIADDILDEFKEYEDYDDFDDFGDASEDGYEDPLEGYEELPEDY